MHELERTWLCNCKVVEVFICVGGGGGGVGCFFYKSCVCAAGAAADVEAITKAVKEENDRIENMTGGYMEGLKKRSVCIILCRIYLYLCI